MITKFVLVTRGRTGSTAVIDELGKCKDIVSTQELFVRNTFSERALKSNFKLLLPFDLWNRKSGWQRMLPMFFSDARQAQRYLAHAEKLAWRQGAKGFVWKVLSHHFEQRPYLGKLLKQRGYKAVYLKRNVVRQVLSGMVANQRGKWNSREKLVDERRYRIDPEKFQELVSWERACVKNDCAWLAAEGFDFVEVDYEDYCDKRDVFFGKILHLLGLPPELPPSSDFVKMIEDLRMVIENYDEVASAAEAIGERL